MCQHLTVARVAEALAVSWDTANDAVLAVGWRVPIGDPNRLDGVAVIGVDEHCWRHTRRGEKYATVIIDLTRCGTVPPGAAAGHGRRPLMFVFQEYSTSLFAWLIVRRNVAFPLKARGMSRRARNRAIDEALGSVGLADAIDRYPWQLSGGMQ